MFIEIGAYDGIRFSNTYYLESQLGWTGLLIEPNPNVFEELQRNRKSPSLQICIAEYSGSQKFQLLTGGPEMLSGLSAHRDERHLDRINKEVSESGASLEEFEVQCLTLNDLCQQHNIKKIDYLSVDVEGAEIACLGAFDFDTIPVSVVSIENNYNDVAIPRLMSQKGFLFHSIVGDEFYVNRSLSCPVDKRAHLR